MDTILEALALLEVENDDHWTADGQPKLITLRALTGQEDLSREDIVRIAPGFTRSDPTLPDPEKMLEDERLAKVKELERQAAEAAVKAKEADMARREAERLRDKLVIEQAREEKPAHVRNMEGIRAVIERSKRDRAEQRGPSELDKSLMYSKRDTQGGSTIRRPGG